MTTKTITMRCKAFSSAAVSVYRLGVSSDGTVRVYDSVAGHYTVCHSLGQAAIRRARKLAGQ
jgi:hypothetical protein